jgi:hypothetical protein
MPAGHMHMSIFLLRCGAQRETRALLILAEGERDNVHAWEGSGGNSHSLVPIDLFMTSALTRSKSCRAHNTPGEISDCQHKSLASPQIGDLMLREGAAVD